MKRRSSTFRSLRSPRIKEFKLQRWPVMIRMISWLLILSMLNITSSCMNYFKVRQSAADENIESFYQKNKTLIIHFNNEAWIMETPKVEDDKVTAIAKTKYIPIIDPVRKDRSNRFKLKSEDNQSSVLNEVHIYLTELTHESDDIISFPLSSIHNIEVYEFDKSTTSASYFLGAVGGAIGVSAVFFLILIATSCPFIYVPDGNGYALLGEIYSGSVQPPLERNDYMKLPNIQQQNYKIKIANELNEIQHTNLLELWIYKHGKNANILVDKYGKAYTIKNPVSPLSVKNIQGKEIQSDVFEMDNRYYNTEPDNNAEALTDAVIAEFPFERQAEFANVVINARNDVILDFMIGEFYDEIGNYYKRWDRKQKKASEEKQRNWTLNQNIPLKLSVERNGAWEYVDYYHIVGPVAMKQDILSIPLTGEESNPLKIKLEFGKYFWNIDYVAVDYSNNVGIEPTVVQASEATNQDNKSVLKQILSDDQKYYIQENGASAILNFVLPNNDSESRTIYLHSKGWYEILRKPSGHPDREYLETFKQPGRFNQFVNDYVSRMAVSE